MLSVRSLMIPVLAIGLASCAGSRKRPIEIAPDTGAKKPIVDPVETPPPETTATIKAKITEEKFKDYLDFTKPVTYDFSYFSVTSKDTLVFVGGEALIQVGGLQVGVAGDMTLTLLQDDKPVLRAVKEGQILQLGGQNIEFTFKLVDEGGSDNNNNNGDTDNNNDNDNGGTDNDNDNDNNGDTDNDNGGTDNDNDNDNGDTDNNSGDEDAEITIEVTIEDE